MRVLFWSLLLGSFLWSCESEQAAKEAKEQIDKEAVIRPESEGTERINTTKFVCEELGVTEEGMPQSKLYLAINDKQHELTDIATCFQLEADEFEGYDIPEAASHAILSYWAGYGECYFMIANGNKVSIYKGEMDEMRDEPIDYSLFAVFENNAVQLK